MADWNIELEGFDTLHVTLSKFDAKVLEPAMHEALTVIAQEAAQFPPQPSRTRSKHFNTWLREKGAYTISTFKTKRGDVRKRPNTRAGRLIRESEKLQKLWKTAKPVLTVTESGISGQITNKASYGVYVQGEKQASFHATTGWKTTSEILDANKARILKVFKDALTRNLGK